MLDWWQIENFLLDLYWSKLPANFTGIWLQISLQSSYSEGKNKHPRPNIDLLSKLRIFEKKKIKLLDKFESVLKSLNNINEVNSIFTNLKNFNKVTNFAEIGWKDSAHSSTNS
jgi:hypothetical protein